MSNDPTTGDIGQVAYVLASLLLAQRPRDLSLTAMSTLAALDRAGPRRLGELAVGEGVTQPSMTTLVTHLEERGLVERRRDPDDGRGVLVSITPAGRAHLDRGRRAVAAGFSARIGRLPREDARALLAAGPAVRRLLDLADACPVRAQERGR